MMKKAGEFTVWHRFCLLEYWYHWLIISGVTVLQNGFRVELQAVDGKLPVPDRHDLPILGTGGDLEAGRQGLLHRGQGVVAGGGDGLWQVREERTGPVQ